MLKIYGVSLSTPCNKVRFVANALDLDYDFVVVNMSEGKHKSEEYLELHPAGKVPVIDDEGFVLFESNAIIKYLNEKNNAGYYPTEHRQRAIVDQWLDFSSQHVGAAMNKVFFNRILAPKFQMEVDAQSLKDGEKFLQNFLPVIHTQLGRHKYLAGAELTLADFNLLAVLDPAEVSQIDLTQFDHITRWRDELRDKGFYKQCFNNSNYTEMLMAMAKE